MTKLAGALGLGLAAVLVGGLALGPTQAQNTDGLDRVALTSQEETTFGRRMLMISIGAHNDATHDMLDGVTPRDETELYRTLMSISAMLNAFPSLYRVEPNPHTEEGEAADPARVSLTTEAAWTDFEAFKAMSYEAARIAEAAAVIGFDQALPLVEELEALCESCHEAYRTEFNYLDYDRLEDFLP